MKMYFVSWRDGSGWYVEAESPEGALAIVDSWYVRVGWKPPCRTRVTASEVIPDTFEVFLEQIQPIVNAHRRGR